MKFDFPLIECEFKMRENRFTAGVTVNEKYHRALIPTTGRLTELLQPGARGYIREAQNCARRTSFDLLYMEYKGVLVCLNATGVNSLLVESIRNGDISQFARYDIRTEYTWGNSRFDAYLTRKRCQPILIEAKSVTLCENGIAMFPDAPTSRGVKHLKELIRAVNERYRAYAIFIAQRPDPKLFKPNWETDPEFSETLREAASHGVKIMAFKCHTSLDEMYITGRIPVRLSNRVGV